jgi:hypothetical protein
MPSSNCLFSHSIILTFPTIHLRLDLGTYATPLPLSSNYILIATPIIITCISPFPASFAIIPMIPSAAFFWVDFAEAAVIVAKATKVITYWIATLFK